MQPKNSKKIEPAVAGGGAFLKIDDCKIVGTGPLLSELILRTSRDGDMSGFPVLRGKAQLSSLQSEIRKRVSNGELAQILIDIAKDTLVAAQARIAAVKILLERTEGPVTQHINLTNVPAHDLSRLSDTDLHILEATLKNAVIDVGEDEEEDDS